MNTTAPKKTAAIGVVTVVVASIGGAVLLASAAQATVSSVWGWGSQSTAETVNAAGVTAIDVDVAAADLSVRFDSSDDARLVTNDAFLQDWTLRVDGDTLIVKSPDLVWNWFGTAWWDDAAAAVLYLPEELRGSDLALDLAAGSLQAAGEFGDLSVRLSAGDVSVDGSADTLDVDVSAGTADLELSDVRSAEYWLTAGDITSRHLDSPDSVDVQVSAGTLDLTVPNVDYRVGRQVTAGSFDSTVSESSTASRTVDVQVSAGDVNLRAAG